MRATLAVTGALLLSIATPVFAHRVDEYLQATTISVERDRVQAQVRLTPGIEVFPEVLALIDADRNGVVSDVEQRRYAERVLGDLSLTIDGERLALRLVSFQFADLDVLRDGRGAIAIDFAAAVPRGGGDRRLVFENHHFRRIAEYLVNGLVPRDAEIRLGTQHRSYDQSTYRLDYAQAGEVLGPTPSESGPVGGGWVAVAALIPLAWLSLWRRRRGSRASGALP
jgi:hypothetical protein